MSNSVKEVTIGGLQLLPPEILLKVLDYIIEPSFRFDVVHSFYVLCWTIHTKLCLILPCLADQLVEQLTKEVRLLTTLEQEKWFELAKAGELFIAMSDASIMRYRAVVATLRSLPDMSWENSIQQARKTADQRIGEVMIALSAADTQHQCAFMNRKLMSRKLVCAQKWCSSSTNSMYI